MMRRPTNSSNIPSETFSTGDAGENATTPASTATRADEARQEEATSTTSSKKEDAHQHRTISKKKVAEQQEHQHATARKAKLCVAPVVVFLLARASLSHFFRGPLGQNIQESYYQGPPAAVGGRSVVTLLPHDRKGAWPEKRRIECGKDTNFECYRSFASRDRFTADVVYFTTGIKTTTNHSIAEQIQKKKNPRQKLGLVSISEAPPCRDLPPDVCNKFDYKIALATTPEVNISVSMAPLSIPPTSGWYNMPTFCLEPDSCLRGAVASVGSPNQWGYFSSIKKYGLSTDSINPAPNPDQNDGHYIRGYWMWELASRFPGVINYSGSTWIRNQEILKKGSTNLARHINISLTHCFPAEQTYCQQSLVTQLDPNRKSKTWNRWSAGKPMQFLQKILLGSIYKFSFEFENKIVDGYITEKFYEGFLSRTLMVYCGPFNAKEIAPGVHSYIDCHDFSNAQELADYLSYLDQNHTAYLEYFEWKKKPLLPKFVEQFYLTRAEIGYDWSQHLLDSRTWMAILPGSIEDDTGWPSLASSRLKEFQVWGSPQYKKQSEKFEQSRHLAGKTWECRLCEMVATEQGEKGNG